MTLRMCRSKRLIGMTAIALCFAAAYSPVVAAQETKKEADLSCSSSYAAFPCPSALAKKETQETQSQQAANLPDIPPAQDQSNPSNSPYRPQDGSNMEATRYCFCLSQILSDLPSAINLRSTPIRRLGRPRLSSPRSPPAGTWRIRKATTLASGRTEPRRSGDSTGIPSPRALPNERRAF
jgi:hypothetical protein